MTTYADQSARDLWLSLCLGEADLSGFSIVRSEQFEKAGILARAMIIGESHAVIVGAGDQCFSEVLACKELPGQGRLFGMRCLNPRQSARLDIGGVGGGKYENEIYLLGGAESSSGDSVFADFSSDIDLKFDFPGEGEPFTRVALSVESGCVRVVTAHWYPNESTMVTSRSTLTGLKG